MVPFEIIVVPPLKGATEAAPQLLDAYKRGYCLRALQARADNSLVYHMEIDTRKRSRRLLPRPTSATLPRPVDNQAMLNAITRAVG